jgi:prepilin-type processing-associated H-X9-DG protein
MDFRHATSMNFAFLDGSVRALTFDKANLTFSKSFGKADSDHTRCRGRLQILVRMAYVFVVRIFRIMRISWSPW